MNLHVLFIQRKEDYDGQLAPEALLVWDEFAVEENPSEFEKQIEKTLDDAGRDDIVSYKILLIAVDQDKIRKKLLSQPNPIKGKLL